MLDLVERVDLGGGEITLNLSPPPLRDAPEVTIRHTMPAQIKRRGVEMRLILDGPSVATKPDRALIKAIVRAHRWFDDLVSGRARTLGEIAEAEGYHKRYVGRLLPLTFLAPDIIEAILAGTQPVDITAEMLTRFSDLLTSWSDQKALLGFNQDHL
ncbi:MAG TPA: hypothetical protein VE631_01025 [Alphaproteobacteria bacterium]|nr:hypothetical protein [Alphaproteobacteria bacterium]